ncbi:hypothetical protein CLF_108183 [Clonorchis sinensis]|uniref:Uncharacterized protein n=1 Tax=Clonorchis sinensis TaxID=79923 RepID=G7YHR8_CLOSI|nr:hypothetical protein CLF_108183 [Clonorchis sinensis]
MRRPGAAQSWKHHKRESQLSSRLCLISPCFRSLSSSDGNTTEHQTNGSVYWIDCASGPGKFTAYELEANFKDCRSENAMQDNAVGDVDARHARLVRKLVDPFTRTHSLESRLVDLTIQFKTSNQLICKLIMCLPSFRAFSQFVGPTPSFVLLDLVSPNTRAFEPEELVIPNFFNVSHKKRKLNDKGPFSIGDIFDRSQSNKQLRIHNKLFPGLREVR